MASQVETRTERIPARRHRVRGLFVLVMGGLAVMAPFYSGAMALFLVGWLLIASGVLEMLESFWAPNDDKLRADYLSGMLSILAGILLLAQPQVVLRGLALLVAGSFLVDGINKIVAAWRTQITSRSWRGMVIAGFINVLLALVLVTRWPVSGQAVVMLLVGVRMLTAGWAMLLGSADQHTLGAETPPSGLYPDGALHLPPHPEFAALVASLQTEDEKRGWVDAVWCWTFVIVFFAIHIGRMRIEWNLVGLISPLVAVLGDVGTALLLAFGMILPCRLAWRRLTRPLERRGWQRLLTRLDQDRGPGLIGRLYRGWLVRRLGFSWRMANMRYSPRIALRWGLQVGLPLTAILIAVNPIWDSAGFSIAKAGLPESGITGPRPAPTPGANRWSWRSRISTGKATSPRIACSESNRKALPAIPTSVFSYLAIPAKAVPLSIACATSICSWASSQMFGFSSFPRM